VEPDPTGREAAHADKVGSYPANRLGLYDRHGNIRRWCADWYRPDYDAHSPAKDLPGPERAGARVIRGGSWCVTAGGYCSAYRGNEAAGFCDGPVGFRVVCDSPE